MSSKTKKSPDSLLSVATRIERRLDEAESAYRRVEVRLTGAGNEETVTQEQEAPGFVESLSRIELAADRLASLALRIEETVGENES